MTPVRLGVVCRPQVPPERLRESVRAAEDAGIDEVWLWEDCFLAGGIAASTAALAATSHVRVGLGLMPVPFRNAAVAAMEIAAVARLHPGRFLPAVGHGVLEWMAQVGARAESPLRLLAEHTAAIRRLLRGETVDVAGRYVHLEQVALGWPAAPVPPLLVGARGPRTLALAGELADGVVLDEHETGAAVAAALEHVWAARDSAGRDDPYQVVCYVGGDAVAERPDLVAEMAEAGATSVVLRSDRPPDQVGPAVAAAVRARG